jgi:uncharacterized cupredoxin-like copper-binding protein
MRKGVLLPALAVVLAVAGSCGAPGSVGVDLDEYSLRAPAEAPAGRVTFSVRNVGEIEHELVIVATSRDPGDLPVEDGVVDVRSPGFRLAGATPRIAPGDEQTLTLSLPRGPYVLLCNVPGHYQSGMRAGFRVR